MDESSGDGRRIGTIESRTAERAMKPSHLMLIIATLLMVGSGWFGLLWLINEPKQSALYLRFVFGCMGAAGLSFLLALCLGDEPADEHGE